MFARFAGGYISCTDYFGSRDRDQRRAWLALSGRTWHVLLPEPPRLISGLADAWAVPAEDEPDGWEWCLRLNNRLWRLPCRQILGPRPALPEGGLRWRRGLVLYSSQLDRGRGQSFFGSLEPGVQVAAELQVVLQLRQ